MAAPTRRSWTARPRTSGEGERLGQAAEGGGRRAEAPRLPPDPRQGPPEDELRDLQRPEATELDLVPDRTGGEERPAHPCCDQALDGLGAVDRKGTAGRPPAPPERGQHDLARARALLADEHQ